MEENVKWSCPNCGDHQQTNLQTPCQKPICATCGYPAVPRKPLYDPRRVHITDRRMQPRDPRQQGPY